MCVNKYILVQISLSPALLLCDPPDTLPLPPGSLTVAVPEQNIISGILILNSQWDKASLGAVRGAGNAVAVSVAGAGLVVSYPGHLLLGAGQVVPFFRHKPRVSPF